MSITETILLVTGPEAAPHMAHKILLYFSEYSPWHIFYLTYHLGPSF